MEDRGDAAICRNLQVPSDGDTWAGGDRHHFLACGSQRIAVGRLHRWLGWGEVRAQQGPQGLCTQGPTQGPTQGWAVLLLSDSAGRVDLGKGVRWKPGASAFAVLPPGTPTPPEDPQAAGSSSAF